MMCFNDLWVGMANRKRGKIMGDIIGLTGTILNAATGGVSDQVRRLTGAAAYAVSSDEER